MSRLTPIFGIVMIGAALSWSASHTPAHAAEFSNPQKVTIRGYGGDAMEPFVTRDGRYLFFNSRNDPGDNPDLFWADRIDDVTFQFRGPIEGVNTPALEGVASMANDGTFYFISPRSYDKTASTIYSGHFADGRVTGVELVKGVSRAKPGIVEFDAEISADGQTLYFVESDFGRSGGPKSAAILFAHRQGDHFEREAASARIMKTINTALDYAPDISNDGLEIFFTRAIPGTGPAIYTAARPDAGAAFGVAHRIEAITGFAEGPAVSSDGHSLYYHRKDGDRLVLYRVTR